MYVLGKLFLAAVTIVASIVGVCIVSWAFDAFLLRLYRNYGFLHSYFHDAKGAHIPEDENTPKKFCKCRYCNKIIWRKDDGSWPHYP